MFPPEIIENILVYCDGVTIKNAREVNAVFRCIVDKLTTKTELWKLRCYSDIPRNELLQYLDKWVPVGESKSYEKWWWMHENWLQWRYNVGRSGRQNYGFDVSYYFPIPGVTCVSASGQYLAVGFENGAVRVFIYTDTQINIKKTFWQLTVPVTSVTMIRDDIDNSVTDVITYYGHNTNIVIVYDFAENEAYEPATFNDCFKFSSYKNIICGVSQCGKVTISKICTDVINKIKSLLTLTYVRIYSPDVVSQCTLWDGVCTLIINDKVKRISYEDLGYSSNLMAVLQNIRLDFATVSHSEKARDIYIFKNDIIISLTEAINIRKVQLFELFILRGSNLSGKKMFLPSKVFHANIRCMFLYGNTFAIGTDNGNVYFYSINDWKQFNLINFVHMESIGDQTPIKSIDVVECAGHRAFYFSSSTKIVKVLGWAVPHECIDLSNLAPACSLWYRSDVRNF